MGSIARFYSTLHFKYQQFMSIVAMLAVITLVAFTMTGCSSSDSDDDSATVEAPTAPTSFSVVRTPDKILSATLSWTAPTTGGAVDSYEIYRSTTPGTVFQESNKVFSLPAEDGKTNYTHIDNVGLTNVETYWVVSAKNAGGEANTVEVMYRPIGPPNGGGDTGYGNNFSAALIFADGIGIGGAALTGTDWATGSADLTQIDTNTGLRPNAEEVANLLAGVYGGAAVTALPYLDPDTIYTIDSVDYYQQHTVSTWQGQWVDGSAEAQHVSGKWGDNLISQRLTTNSIIRIEMVLSKALPAVMTSYTMKSLYGVNENEIQGTDGTTYDNSTGFVFATNARLKIQKLDGGGSPDGTAIYDNGLWHGDGPGNFAAEVNIAGNFTYGFVWNLKNQTLPGDVTTGKAGTWRITFYLANDNSGAGGGVPAANNNTFIDTVENGVRVSDTEVYIDITVE